MNIDLYNNYVEAIQWDIASYDLLNAKLILTKKTFHLMIDNGNSHDLAPILTIYDVYEIIDN